MPYRFTVPNDMRVFLSAEKGGPTLRRTNRIAHQGEVLRVDCVEIKTYDHHDNLVLKLAKDEGYLLVEDTTEGIWMLARQWSQVHEKRYSKDHAEKEAADTLRERLEKDIGVLIRQYVKADLVVVGDTPIAAFDKEGPGIHPVFPMFQL